MSDQQTASSQQFIEIAGRKIGPGYPTYFIAELSANHGQNFENCLKLIDEAAKAGADAIKIQTYRPDTITLNCDSEYFQLTGNSPWAGQTLYQLYEKAYTPWEWVPELKKRANELSLPLFSSPFDITAVEFLESLNVPAYKIASFELTDHILLKKVAQTGKPIIISTGMASLSDIEEAVSILRTNGTSQIAMLKCTSAYPASLEDANLRTIPHMAQTFGVVPGLSDHTLDLEVPITSVVLGACLIEKHFTMSRMSGGPDDAFSLEPIEFASMVKAIRNTEQCMGRITYGGVKSEESHKLLRRSLFIVCDLQNGELLTPENVKSIRPGHGLHTRHYDEIIGKRIRKSVSRGTPLSWDLID